MTVLGFQNSSSRVLAPTDTIVNLEIHALCVWFGSSRALDLESDVKPYTNFASCLRTQTYLPLICRNK